MCYTYCMLKDYDNYMNDEKGFLKGSMSEHFKRYSECDCVLWRGRVGGYSDWNSIFNCDRCDISTEVDSIIISEAVDEYRTLFGSFVRLQLGLEWDDRFEICHCCSKDLEKMMGE